jgi:prolyl oligopeptidase
LDPISKEEGAMRLQRWRRRSAASLFIAAVLALPIAAGAGQKLDYPKAKTVDQVDDFFGTKVADPYRWLENTEDPEVQAWVESENALTQGEISKVPFRSDIAKRLTELLNYPRVGLPVKHGEWVFFSKNNGLQNQSVIYKQKGLKGEPTALLDPNAMSKDGTVSISALSYSHDGKLVGYGLSQSGSDWQTLHVRDVATGKDRKDVLERCRFTDIAWAPDASGFYYSRYPTPGSVAKEDEEHWQKLYYHKLGDAQSKDRLVYERTDDKECGASASVSDDGHWLFVGVWKGTAPENELYVQRLDKPGSTVEPLFTGFDANWEPIESVGDKIYLITDKDAPRKRIVCVDMAGDRKPVTLVPEGGDVIESTTLANGQLFVRSMHNAHYRLQNYALDGKALRDVALPTLGTIGSLSGQPQDPDLFVSFSSFLFPSQNYKYNFQTGALDLYQEAALDFDRDAYVARQVFYESKDGTKVPMFLVHRKGLRLDGNNPTLLYGYGGFNQSMTPTFSTTRLFWLEQGGVFALANLRGGGEFGEEWHKAGTLDRKQNVFDDFIAAGQWLCDNDYTRPSMLAIQGGSNGGLLTAACTLQRPDLFGAVLCQVPVIDMLRYHRFTIGSYWKSDYGDPENKDQFKALYAYSPAHNVRPGTAYPAMLITTADTDTRVHPSHAKKFAAAMQAATSSDAPILLRVETKAGHGAGKPTSKQIEENSDLLGFLMSRLGMSYVPPSGQAASRGSN